MAARNKPDYQSRAALSRATSAKPVQKNKHSAGSFSSDPRQHNTPLYKNLFPECAKPSAGHVLRAQGPNTAVTFAHRGALDAPSARSTSASMPMNPPPPRRTRPRWRRTAVCYSQDPFRESIGRQLHAASPSSWGAPGLGLWTLSIRIRRRDYHGNTLSVLFTAVSVDIFHYYRRCLPLNYHGHGYCLPMS